MKFLISIFYLFFILANYLFSNDIIFLDLKLDQNRVYKYSFKSSCLNCHKNISLISKNHKFRCINCHDGNNTSFNIKIAHKNIIKNPSELKYAKIKCIKCHKQDIEKVSRSLMSLNPGIINITRFLWGNQQTPLAKYAILKTNKTEKIPSYTLVDDFLRKVCLRCHINTEGSKRYGEIRSSGCASCHVLYTNSGKATHTFTKEIPSAQCLHCHNFNRVGMDYVGYFEHDYSRIYRSPIYKGKLPPKIYGIFQHRLKEDIHFLRGMDCIDCHKKDEIMGNGKILNFKFEAINVRCINCHKNKKFIITKIKNKKLNVPVFDENILSHKLHRKLECYSCHSIWGFQDYGLNVIREDSQNYFKWKYLKDTNIPDIQNILNQSLGIYGDLYRLRQGKKINKFLKPKMVDYISNQKKEGLWFIGWIYRRWEEPILGINQRKKISPIRPDYQFFLSYIDSNMKIKINNKKLGFNWSPYVPHTTTKKGRGCYSCHQNIKVLGLGYGMISKNKEKILNIFNLKKDSVNFQYPLEKIIDINGNQLQKFIYPNSSPLEIRTIKKLLFF